MPLPDATALPPSVRDLLWDVDPADVHLPRHRDFLIARILARGTWAAVEWLRREVGDTAIAEYLGRTRGRVPSRRQLRFWELVLGLEHDVVSGWIADREVAAWDSPGIRRSA